MAVILTVSVLSVKQRSHNDRCLFSCLYLSSCFFQQFIEIWHRGKGESLFWTTDLQKLILRSFCPPNLEKLAHSVTANTRVDCCGDSVPITKLLHGSSCRFLLCTNGIHEAQNQNQLLQLEKPAAQGWGPGDGGKAEVRMSVFDCDL